MKVGIVGYAGSGKSTVFQWLTGVAPDLSKIQSGQLGQAKIPDTRLDWLTGVYSPKKTTPATLEFLDTPGLMPSERKDNPRRLGIIREGGGLLVVLNGYSETDLASQLQRFREELIFADLEIVLRRVEKLEDQVKKPRPTKEREADQFELDLLRRIVTVLEDGKAPSVLDLKEEEEKAIRSFQMLTLKKELVLVNCGEDMLGKSPPDDLLALCSDPIVAPARLEMELKDLSDEDRAMFMEDLGITGFVRDTVLQTIFSSMDQIVFFTVGHDECRAWPVPIGATAPEGAGEIHTDLEQRFVRAEVVSYPDFEKVGGTMKEAKAQGVYRLEGKTYVIQEGDIMHILAST